MARPIVRRNADSVTRLPAFSHAVVAGDHVHCAGTLGTLPPPEFGLVEGGTGPETRQALLNLKRILDTAGASLDDLVKVTVYLSDLTTFPEMDEVYRELVPSAPARVTVGAELVIGAAVEIDALAYRSGGER